MKSSESQWTTSLVSLTVLLLTLCATSDAAPQGTAGVDTEMGLRAKTLLESLAANPAANGDAITKELLGYGAPLLPTLKALERAMVTPSQIEVMAIVRNQFEDPGLSTWLASVATSAESEDARIAAYQALEISGDRECLSLLLGSLPGNPPTVKRHADRAVVAVLRRSDDNASYAVVEKSLPDLTDEDRARIAACVAKADSPRGIGLLGRLLGQYGNIELTILSGLAGMKTRPADGSLAVRIRPLLSSENSNLRREALSALGKLHDGESVEDFLGLLGGEHAGVAGNAHWALRRVSGLNLPRDPVRWKLWLTAERSWWEEEGRHLLSALREGADEQVLRALHQASLHRLYREEFEPFLLEYAESSDPEFRAAAVLALDRLGLGNGPAPAIRGSGSITSLTPIPASEALAMLVPLSKHEQEQEDPPEEGSTLFLFLLGVPVCLSLLMKVSGIVSVDRLRSWFAGSATDQGPVTIKLKPRAGRRPGGGPGK